MRIVIKPAKPRNPVAVAAKKRRGDVHGAYQPARRSRRAAKRELQQLIKQI